ncbi:hypothetical protein BD770DRAFT_406812 [Pilaira anomala]|nr:hypothetical protein BD770DRAFT_406812 [Pilaira anomala]
MTGRILSSVVGQQIYTVESGLLLEQTRILGTTYSRRTNAWDPVDRTEMRSCLGHLIRVKEEHLTLRKKQYSQDDMYHIAGLFERYYLIDNNCGNALSPYKVQISKAHWTELAGDYNKRQKSLPSGLGFFRTEKTLTDTWAAMKTQYQD